MLECEAHISSSLQPQAFRRIGAALLIRSLQRIAEIAETQRRHFGKEPSGVLEMMRRRRGRDPYPTGRLPQSKPVDAALENNLLGRIEQFLPQVAVVVPPALLFHPRVFYLDTVQIAL